MASLVTSLQRANARHTDPLAVGAEWDHKLHLGVSRGVAFDRRQDEEWCHHLQYADLVDDPIGSVRSLYAHFGEEVSPLHARRMQVWMRDRPQDVFGRHVYDAVDFGLSRDGISERYAEYTERFAVPEEVGAL